jgi:hypothetical protein
MKTVKKRVCKSVWRQQNKGRYLERVKRQGGNEGLDNGVGGRGWGREWQAADLHLHNACSVACAASRITREFTTRLSYFGLTAASATAQNNAIDQNIAIDGMTAAT